MTTETSEMIIRRVRVNRTLTPMKVIDATGRAKFVNNAIVETMPIGEGEEVDVVFFKPDLSDKGGNISDAELAKEFESRGLTPDPRAQAKVNEEDLGFADEHPNGTHWKDGNSYNFAAFDRWRDRRDVSVGRSDGVWGDSWWFAGVRLPD
jgi:hypothetical protein